MDSTNKKNDKYWDGKGYNSEVAVWYSEKPKELGTGYTEETTIIKVEDKQTAQSSKNYEDTLRAGIGKEFGATGTLAAIGGNDNVTQVNITGGSVTSTSGDVNLNAQSSGGILSIAVGAAGGGGTGAGAGFSWNNIGGATGVITDKAKIDSQDTLSAWSDSTNRIIAVSVGAGGGGTAGIGAGVSVNNLSAINKVSFTNTDTTAANNVLLYAHNSGDIIAVNVGVAGGGAAGAGAAVTVNLLNGKTIAEILGKETKSTVGSVSVKAENESDIISVAVAGAGGGAAGVAGAVAVNLINGETKARIGDKDHNTTVFGKTGVNIDSLSSGDITSVAVGAAGGGAAGVAVDVAVNIITRTTGAYLENATLPDIGNDGTLHILADSTNEITSTIVGVAGGGGAGVAVLIGTNVISGTTETKVLNSANVHADVMEIGARNYSVSNGVSVSIAGGYVGVGIQTDIHTLSQTVQTVIDNSQLYATSGDLTVESKDTKSVNSVVVGVAGGAVGVAGAADVVVVSGTNKIDIINSVLEANNLLKVNAKSTNKLNQTAVLVAFGVAGVGIPVAVNEFGQQTNVNISSSSLISKNSDIEISAKGTSNLNNIDVHSFAGGVVGVAGSVAVSVVEDTTDVTVTGGSLTANSGEVKLEAQNTVSSNAVVGGAAGGVVGVGAGVEVLVVRNSSALEVSSTIDAKTITLNSALTRDIDDTAYAGGVGAVGIAAAISVINLGGTEINIDEKNNFTASVNKAKEQSGRTDINLTEDKTGSATLAIGGVLTATNSINANATVNNTIEQEAYGVGIGGVGGAAAVAVMNVKDTITASFTGQATATNDFRLQGESVNTAATNTVAGAGGLGALGAAVSNVSFTSNVTTTIGEGSVLRGGTKADISAIQRFEDFNIDVDGTAVGAVGAGGAVSTLNLNGDTLVHIGTENGKDVEIYSPDVSIRAEKNYGNINMETSALAGGLVGGAGTRSAMSIGGNAYVYLKNTKIYSRENTNPQSGDNVILEAVIDVQNTKNVGQVDAGGLAAVADGDTNMSAMVFNTLVDIAGSDILTGTITADAWQTLNASAHHTTMAAGAAGVAGGSSSLKWTGNNKINVTDNSQFYSWWGDTDFTAGKGLSELDAQTRVFNYSLIPVTTGGMTSAVVDVNVKNDIDLSNATVYSVYDIGLKTGGQYNLGAYDKIINIYNMGGDFIGGNDFSRVEASGKIIRSFSNNVTLNDSWLEAGYHWDSWVMIRNIGNNSEDYRNMVLDDNGNIISVTDRSGTFTKDRYNIVPIYGENNEIVAVAVYQPWIAINPTSSKESIFIHINDQIKALESNILEDLLHEQWGDAELKAVEISQLKRLLNDYFIGG